MFLSDSALESKACSTKHNKREYIQPTETHMGIERTHMFNNISNNKRQQFPHQKF
jgi:hypothetical protein